MISSRRSAANSKLFCCDNNEDYMTDILFLVLVVIAPTSQYATTHFSSHWRGNFNLLFAEQRNRYASLNLFDKLKMPSEKIENWMFHFGMKIWFVVCTVPYRTVNNSVYNTFRVGVEWSSFVILYFVLCTALCSRLCDVLSTPSPSREKLLPKQFSCWTLPSRNVW